MPVDAFRIGYEEKPFWFLEQLQLGKIHSVGNGHIECYLIDTLEGTMRADHGNYLVKGSMGECWCVRYDIFESTYEKVED